MKEWLFMKVGLVRHFKVSKGLPNKMMINPDELTQWFQEYDLSGVEDGKTDLRDIHWNRCYSSDMPRAVKTAEAIYTGKIVKMQELREIQYPYFKLISKRKLPFLLWAFLAKAAWKINHKSFPERKYHVRKRIAAALDQILLPSKDNVLIVSHAALMMEMRKELLRRGFTGPKFRTAANGRLYVFEMLSN